VSPEFEEPAQLIEVRQVPIGRVEPAIDEAGVPRDAALARVHVDGKARRAQEQWQAPGRDPIALLHEEQHPGPGVVNADTLDHDNLRLE
jgi:hypothetical protein